MEFVVCLMKDNCGFLVFLPGYKSVTMCTEETAAY